MTANDESIIQPSRRSGVGLRMVLALALLAFVGGALIMAWVARDWDGWRLPRQDQPLEMEGDQPQNAADGVAVPTAVDATAIKPALDAQAARAAELEQQLARIAVAAQTAAGNANRAEAMMTAFAARRALDAGRPLGYVEQTLRLRFGEAQPKAVATIVNAAAEPVTLADLRAGLDDIVVAREARGTGGDWWSAFWREIQGLAVIRRAGEASPEPEQRLARARRAVELGQMDAAIAEMSALPQDAGIARWLESARRYNEAHRALDLVEAAAILEPRNGPPAAAPAPAPAAVAPTQAAPAAQVGNVTAR